MYFWISFHRVSSPRERLLNFARRAAASVYVAGGASVFSSSFANVPAHVRRELLLRHGFPLQGTRSTPKGYGYALGKEKISNAEVMRICGMSSSKSPAGVGFLNASGIGWRHWRGNEGIDSLHARAFDKMVVLNPETREELEEILRSGGQVAILVGGNGGPQQPSMAHIMQGYLQRTRELALPPAQVRGWKIDSVCSTGAGVFSTAAALIGRDEVQGVLAFINGDYEGSNVLDKTPDGKSNGNAFFGSAVACTWISRARIRGHQIFKPVYYSDGGNAYVIQIVPDARNQILRLPEHARAGCFTMDSPAVQSAVKAQLPEFMERLLQAYGMENEGLKHFKYFFPHTGNITMLDEAFKRFNYPMSRVAWGGTHDGNVDAASFLKDVAKTHEAGLLDVGDLLGAVVYGGGFQMGAWGWVNEARPPQGTMSERMGPDAPEFQSVQYFYDHKEEIIAQLEAEHRQLEESRRNFNIDP